ncbi:SsgA family sporulation/cell division regulator [Streptomyces arenae]|uniref:SsgA family sporulation/cell division regulator n=1 Tax=Streptomyces arenae TaxID=29301 RepID=UPI00265A2C53|nr:SsgA family sporulation/cell division regulator [Streptomyces arenae]MCG7207236.1 SsgA family sporulation/cell division regulator [Streptomyces arenae]
MESSRTVVRGLTARLVASRVCSLPLRMRLRYEPADPCAVRATFFPHGAEPVEWVLGRDLLADGLEGRAGHGDVRIWSATGRGDQAMYIALGSRAGSALLEVPVRDVRSFLESTEALVPRGTEAGRIDWDTELAYLLPQS